MALLYCDGFDQYENTNDFNEIYSDNLRSFLSTRFARTGSKAIELQESSNLSGSFRHNHNLNVSDGTLGFAIYQGNTNGPNHIRVSMETSGQLTRFGIDAGIAFLEHNNIVYNSTVTLNANTWYFVEIYRRAGDINTGQVVLYIDGNPIVSFNGEVTGNFNATFFRKGSGSGTLIRPYVDDYYIASGLPLGNISIQTTFVDTVEFNSGFSFDGADSFVDALNESAGSIVGPNSGDNIIFNIADLGLNVAAIYGATIFLDGFSANGGDEYTVELINSDNQSIISNNIVMSNNERKDTIIFPIDPNGNAFTPEEFNNYRLRISKV